jgi:hypothetical protein
MSLFLRVMWSRRKGTKDELTSLLEAVSWSVPKCGQHRLGTSARHMSCCFCSIISHSRWYFLRHSVPAMHLMIFVCVGEGVHAWLFLEILQTMRMLSWMQLFVIGVS